MILGLIPARGGSKGIPRKSIKLFCGRPLLAYSIEIGLKCDFIDEVVVSTEDPKIAEAGRVYGAKALYRSMELAQDDTPMMPVLQHACENYSDAEIIILLDPTSPLRIAEDVKGAYELFKKGDCNAVISGCLAKHHPDFNMVNVNPDDYVQLFTPIGVDMGSRQQCPPVYNLDTTVWIYSREAIIFGRRIPPKTKLYLVPEERFCHIDIEFDWEIAEYLYKKYHV